jgi:hypothetical protein
MQPGVVVRDWQVQHHSRHHSLHRLRSWQVRSKLCHCLQLLSRRILRRVHRPVRVHNMRRHHHCPEHWPDGVRNHLCPDTLPDRWRAHEIPDIRTHFNYRVAYRVADQVAHRVAHQAADQVAHRVPD